METGNSNPELEEQPPIFQYPVSNPIGDRRSSSRFIFIAAAGLAVVVVLAIIASRHRTHSSHIETPLTAEQKDYLANIAVSEVKMSAAENFLGQTVIYMDGQVANNGSRSVKEIEVQLEFVDILGQIVLRDRAKPLSPPAPPLKPGENRAFQLFFDHMSTQWNQAPPRVTIRSVQF